MSIESHNEYINNEDEVFKNLCVKFINDSYDIDNNNKIKNNIFLENSWLEEKIKLDTIENITNILIMLPDNNYFNFKGYHITFLLDNYRLNKEDKEDNSLFYGKKKEKEIKTIYIYTKQNIYYTNCNKLKNGNYFTIIPRLNN